MIMHNIWTIDKVKKLFNKSFLDLMYKAQKIHRKHFDPNIIQISMLLSIKTGLCPEDCKYCSQSSRYKTNTKINKLIDTKKILIAAKKAKKAGSQRFCMGAAWSNINDRDIPYLENIIKKIKKIGIETCMTLGGVNNKQAKKLAKAGLDFYNHNLDTSPKFYKKIITTRKYQDRIDTINNISNAGIKICSGGIIGLGESIEDRANLLIQLANLKKQPTSIPINMLVNIKGTPLEKNKIIDPFDFIRMIAVTRIMMQKSYVRLSAGREKMNEQTQAMCFMAGANSIFYGCKLLTTKNNSQKKDNKLFNKLGINKYKKQKIKKIEKKTKTLYYNAAL
ncbi:Biotin synthase [Candidatus Purcelliella pentastirinorum]|uniref:Biotin synthase n=2 Tax=Candidatus Purcelliella pentastirinorum TaxID=472834 RepID=A0A346DZW3_9ENTR|nr:Biotin synthase [Candidatus Purcelliella pentastirinorum]